MKNYWFFSWVNLTIIISFINWSYFLYYYIMRQKFCALCDIDSNTMYRIIYRHSGDWIFVCKQCLLNVKNNNPHYKYGGTWKR